jgi:NADH dehydrogenase FAD-containing subunit
VLILGGSFAGLSSAHYFLKHILPTLADKESYNVTLVNESSKFYARPATPRAAASHKLMPVNKVFLDIEAGFKSYPAGQFTFVHGSAAALDEKTKTATISLVSGGEQKINYTGLVIATGTRTVTPVLGLLGDYKLTEDAQTQFQAALPDAKTIVIAGGGPAAVETAGEIAELLNGKPGFFGGVTKKHDITIITSEAKLLPLVRPAIAAQAEAQLKKLGVDVIYNTRVESVAPESAGTINVVEKAVLTLSTGETKEADLYIPATGVKPNTTFVPTHLLNEKGFVVVNPTTLRVDEAGTGVFAAGDVSSSARWGIMDIYSSIPIIMSNLKRDLSAPVGEKASGPDRQWKANTKETQLVTVGSGGGAGAMMGVKMPSFAIKLIKGRDYFVSRAPPIVNGSHWAKESKWNGA